MKYTNVKAFEKHVQGSDKDHLADIYALIGKESFEVKKAADKLIAVLLSSETDPALALKIYQGEALDLNDLMQELRSFPFFCKKRVVLIQNAENLSKQEIAKLEDYFSSPNRAACLIFTASAINRSTNFYKKLEKAGVILDIAEEKPWEKEKSSKEWVMAKVAEDKKKITEEAVHALIAQAGTNQAFLFQEIEKLICFIGDRNEITAKDVAVITSSVNSDTIWQLSDAIFSRNGLHAFQIMKSLMEEGTAFLALLRQIRAQVQTHYQICTILANGGGSSGVTAAYPYMKGRILENNMQLASSYGLVRFKKAMLKIDETESFAKNGIGSDNALAEMLITHLVV